MRKLFCFILIVLLGVIGVQAQTMMYCDNSRKGIPFSKDPFVIKYKNSYFMYYSLPPSNDGKFNWGIGVAESSDLINWQKKGEINSLEDVEGKKVGICAPCALVRNDTLHLFYQTYGVGKNDAICHAYSLDGLNFIRNKTNPIFSPTGDWNCGRAIDAEVFFFKGEYYMYFATRDKDFRKQILGVAKADKGTSFSRGEWKMACPTSILVPELSWEGECIEAPSIVERNGKLYMFYAGNYNNCPQQIGVAESEDGVNWSRCMSEPLLKAGKEYSWNSSESGHPCIFKDGKNYYLFYQGNSTKGKTWKLSFVEVKWSKGLPKLK